MVDIETTARLFREEAKKLGVTLGVEHSINWVVNERATEQETREKVREWIQAIEDAKKKKKK